MIDKTFQLPMMKTVNKGQSHLERKKGPDRNRSQIGNQIGMEAGSV